MKNLTLKLFAVVLAAMGAGIFVTSLVMAHPQLIASDEESESCADGKNT